MLMYEQMNLSYIAFLEYLVDRFPTNQHVIDRLAIIQALHKRFKTHSNNIYNLLKNGVETEAKRASVSFEDVIDRINLVDVDTCCNVTWLAQICFHEMYQAMKQKKNLTNKLQKLCHQLLMIHACGSQLEQFNDIATKISSKDNLPDPKRNPQGFLKFMAQTMSEHSHVVDNIVDALNTDQNDHDIKRSLMSLLRDPNDTTSEDIDIDEVLAGFQEILPQGMRFNTSPETE